MADLFLIKAEDGSLHPSSDVEREHLKRFRAGEVFLAKVTMKRNGRHHRLGMALLHEVFNNQDRHDIFENFLTEVKILTGHVETFVSSTGQIFYKVRSIDFTSMDEMEFTAWKNDALTAVFQHFIPDMTPAEQERVINNLIARM